MFQGIRSGRVTFLQENGVQRVEFAHKSGKLVSYWHGRRTGLVP